jgi:hypothetical protein
MTRAQLSTATTEAELQLFEERRLRYRFLNEVIAPLEKRNLELEIIKLEQDISNN